jgi:hypothetical protein
MPVVASDETKVERTVFACTCGATVAVVRRTCIELPHDSHIAARMREVGPFEGECPQCGRPTHAQAPWLEVDADARTATLVIPGQRRGDVIEILRAHLAWLAAHPRVVRPWMLQPQLSYLDATEQTARRAVSDSSVTSLGRPRRTGQHAIPVEPSHDTEREPGTPVPIAPGVPLAISSDGKPELDPRRVSIGAHTGELGCDEHGAVLSFTAADTTALTKWRDAKLDARPIHLRGRGYPLLGVRVVGSWMGQLGCVDAFVDIGQTTSQAVFRTLAQRFALRLVIAGPSGEAIVREVTAPRLEANAALCLESAHAAMSTGDHPPSGFAVAVAAAAAEGIEERLTQTKVNIPPGAYMHIIGAREASRALEHIDRVSRKETLARLLEVEGLPMAEYDAIRRRVLAGALEHGIVAPRRFWRRVVASGLADDLSDYVRKLVRNRELHEGEEGDLDPDASRQAWQGILDLCQRKDVAIPDALRRALDLPESVLEPRATTSAPSARAGVIDVVDATSEPTLVARLADPRLRLRAAADVLQNPRTTSRELDHLFASLESFDQDELLAILPELSELGSRAATGMVDKLRSPRRELRQAASILLGMALDPDAIGPLAEALVVEPTNVWLDVARALGGYGPIALRRICQLLRREAGSPRESATIERVARALAEIALSDGTLDPDGPRPGHDAVAALAEAPDPRVSTAARRALATLRDVRESGAAIRGELPLGEVTEIRGFSRRAYEAIMVPELEVEADG